MLDFIKMLLCNHNYETKSFCTQSLHSQMVCKKCGKCKYNFEG